MALSHSDVVCYPYARQLNYWQNDFQEYTWKKENGPKYDVIYNPKPIFEPESHYAYSWLKTTEHMFSVYVFTLGRHLSEGHPEVRISPPRQWEHPLFLPRSSTGYRPLSLHYSRQRVVLDYSTIWTGAAICPSTSARKEAVTHITCRLMSEKKLKTAQPIWTCLTEMSPHQGLLLFCPNLISGKRFLPSERGFWSSSHAPTAPIIIILMCLFGNNKLRDKCDAQSQTQWLVSHILVPLPVSAAAQHSYWTKCSRADLTLPN